MSRSGGGPALAGDPPRARRRTLRLQLRQTDSTTDRARELALAGAPHGTLVTAGEQSAGRGRQGRRWSAPAGSALLMSLLLRDPPALLPLIAALAVADVAGQRAQIKCPNDVVLAREPARGDGTDSGGPLAKVAGILAEGRPHLHGHRQEGWAVLGIGVNVAVRIEDLPAELHGTAATLGRSPADVEPTLAALLQALERRLAEPTDAMLQTWRARDVLLGRAIAWSGGEGVADGIDGDGRLVVALAGGGRTTLDAGE